MKRKIVMLFSVLLGVFGCSDEVVLSEKQNDTPVAGYAEKEENKDITIHGTFYTEDKAIPFIEVPAIASIQSMDKNGNITTLISQNVKAQYDTGFLGSYRLTINTKELPKNAFNFIHIEARKEGELLWENNRAVAKISTLAQDSVMDFVVQ